MTAVSRLCRVDAGNRMKTVCAALFLVVSVITATCAEEVLFQDNFAGKLGEGWSWVREHPGAWRLTPRGLPQGLVHGPH